MGSREPRPHEKLEAWQQAMRLVKAIYGQTQSFPKEEVFGLTQQMRRAAVSIPSNLAEGAARQGAREYAHFISIARGSLSEIETQLQIAQMLGYCNESETINEILDQLGRLLTGLHKKWSQA